MVASVNPNGDGNNIKYIFDQPNADIIVRLSGLELEVFPDEPTAKMMPAVTLVNPIFSNNAYYIHSANTFGNGESGCENKADRPLVCGG